MIESIQIICCQKLSNLNSLENVNAPLIYEHTLCDLKIWIFITPHNNDNINVMYLPTVCSCIQGERHGKKRERDRQKKIKISALMVMDMKITNRILMSRQYTHM